MNRETLRTAPEPPLRRAVMAGQVGAVVRLARKAAGITQRELGDLCGGYGQSTISRIEDGTTRNPPPNMLRRIADITGIPAEWVGIASSPVVAADSARAPRNAAQDDLLRDSIPVTARTIRHLKVCIENYWRLDDEIGGRMLRRAVAAQFDDASRLLATGTVRDPVRDQLIGATTELARLAGWTLFDGRHFASAERYYKKACDIAEEATDPTLRANVLATMSLRATYDDNATEAAELAQVAEDVARPAATPRVSSLLAMRTAFALAALDDRRGCNTALAKAERLLSQASDGDDDPAWASYFTEPKFLADLGIARARLGDCASAVPLIEAALERQDHRNHRLRAFHAVWLARAQLRLGAVDEACAAGLRAIEYAEAVESSRINWHLHELRDFLRPHDDNPAVRHYVTRLLR
jgi:transcriptional regulator with XRE-family HTH domain